MTYTIYLRTNKVNGMQYVGQTGDFKNRERCWRCLTANYSNCYIDEDREKYGLDNFNVVIIDHCETQEEADNLEKYYIKKLDTKYPNGYNMSDGGKGNNGFKHSEKTIEKLKDIHKGKLSGKNNPFYGKHHTDITKKIMSETHKCKHYSPSTEFPKRKVNQYDLDGNFIKTWESFAAIEKELGFSKSSICNCCKGKYKTAYGYIWGYA